MNELRSAAREFFIDKMYSYEGGLEIAGGVTGGLAGGLAGGALYTKLNRSKDKTAKYTEELKGSLNPSQSALFKKLQQLSKDANEANTVTEAKLTYANYKAKRTQFERSLDKGSLVKYAAALDHMDRMMKGLVRSITAGMVVGGLAGSYGGSKLGKAIDKRK